MRILVSFLSALALLTTQSICVEAQSAIAIENNATEVTPDDPVDRDHCTDKVEVVRTCYDNDENGPLKIEVKVINCNPYGKDWIAIYDDDTDNSEVGNDKGFEYWGTSKDWTFLCGTRECNVPIHTKTIYFLKNRLDEGDYKIYLFRNNGFRVDAESESFTIKKHHYCPTSHPAPSHKPHPTPHPAPSHKPHPTPHPAPSHKPHPTHYPTHDPAPHPNPSPHSHPHPTQHPTPSNKPTAKPTDDTPFPTVSPTDFCEEDTTQKFELWKSGKIKKCKWAGKKINKVDSRCNQRTSEFGTKVKDKCPRTCKTCRN